MLVLLRFARNGLYVTLASTYGSTHVTSDAAAEPRTYSTANIASHLTTYGGPDVPTVCRPDAATIRGPDVAAVARAHAAAVPPTHPPAVAGAHAATECCPHPSTECGPDAAA